MHHCRKGPACDIQHLNMPPIIFPLLPPLFSLPSLVTSVPKQRFPPTPNPASPPSSPHPPAPPPSSKTPASATTYPTSTPSPTVLAPLAIRLSSSLQATSLIHTAQIT